MKHLFHGEPLEHAGAERHSRSDRNASPSQSIGLDPADTPAASFRPVLQVSLDPINRSLGPTSSNIDCFNFCIARCSNWRTRSLLTPSSQPSSFA
jgi:hypothetical protein